MRTPFSILLIFFNLLCISASARDGSTNDLQLHVANIAQSGSLTVEVSNSSKRPIRIWEEDNSWGAARWRVLRIRAGRLETFFQNPNRIFTMNMPTSEEIAPGALVEHKLDLNGGNWCGLGHCGGYNEHGFGGEKADFQRGDTLIVLYDVPSTNEAGKMGVWYGVTAASATFK